MLDKTANSGFSKEGLKRALADEKTQKENSVQLNELANNIAEQFASNTVRPLVLMGVVRLCEFLVLISAGLVLFFTTMWPDAGIASGYVYSSFLGAILTVSFLQGIDGYLVSSLKRVGLSISKAITALALATVILSAFIYIMRGIENFPLEWLLSWFGYATCSLVVVRLIEAIIISRMANAGRLDRRAVIVGGGEGAAEVIRGLENSRDQDIQICGVFDDRTDDRSPEIIVGYPKLGTVSELVEFARKAHVNMLIVTLPLTAEKRLLQLLKRLWVLPVDIRLSAHSNKLHFRARSYTYEGSVPLVDVFDKPIADWDAITKRIFDVIVASAAIVLLSPLMLLTALAVRLDSKGPIIFKQMREGFNNEPIEVYKFRSLYTDLGDSSGVNVVKKGDNRVTRVGKIIRKTSIDELPQLFNVLQGTLSLVGPRPHVPNAQTGNRLWTEVVDSYIARHKVKPGVTGWAQVTGWRGEVDNEEKLKGRVDADLYYIENWSLMFDFYILAITPFRLLNTENAY
ncbi:MAG: undecaprenyl-phosphate glucose phosphotransferase [Rhizobiaceae bacterium]|nr:undecaprenyl-phosphate glucose phosphotransferase [Rhizobiaceae bacterium]